MKAWSDLRQVDLLPWQIDAIISLDFKRRSLVGKDPIRPDKPTRTAELFPEKVVKRFRPDGRAIN